MKRFHRSYERLLRDWKSMAHLDEAAALLEWDQEAFMPSAAVKQRSEQIAAIVSASFRALRDNRLYHRMQYLLRAVKERRIRGKAAKNIVIAHDMAMEARKVPVQMEGEGVRLSGIGYDAWVKGRQKNDFSEFVPILERIVEGQRAYARRVADDPKDLYTPLIHLYDGDFTATEITKIFRALKKDLAPVAERVRACPPVDARFVKRVYDEKRLDAFTRTIIWDMGFDFSRGRMDIAAHPMCFGATMDTRLLTRYADDGLDSIFSGIHEAGHGLYAQGIPVKDIGTPIGDSASMSVDESESRFWEVFIGKSRPFLRHYFPTLKRLFPSQLRGVGFETFYRGVNGVRNPLIRIKTDLLTYCFHIFLRFDIERALIAGDLQVKDIPDEWNRQCKDLFGMKLKDAKTGWAQDPHWAGGAFGYFPTYQIGNMIAAQKYYALRRSRRTLDEDLAHGNFLPIRDWLCRRIHRHGARYGTKALVRHATGAPLCTGAFLRFIREKYSDVYGVDL